MKNLRKRQLYITLVYFIPVLIVIGLSTFYVLRMHRAAFNDIRDSLWEHATDAEYLNLRHDITEIITEDDWENLSEADIDAKLAHFGIEPIGDQENPFYSYTPKEIDQFSEDEYNQLVPDDFKEGVPDSLIGIDFNDDNTFSIEYVSLAEYELIANQLYRTTYRIILISSGLLILIFGYLSYRLSIVVMRPIVRAFEQQQQFMSDISHELRTPVAILQSEVDVIKRLSKITKEREERFIANVGTTTGQLNHIVNQLMTLGRLDTSLEIQKSSLDLVPYIQDSLVQFTEAATEKHINFETKGLNGSKMILAENGFLSQVIMIVMDNAIKYSHENSPIYVSLEEGKKFIDLYIDNTTDPISQEQLKRLFERMYRLSESRHDGGLGLGLSIAEQIMNAFKGAIRLENTHKGVRTILRFPKA